MDLVVARVHRLVVLHLLLDRLDPVHGMYGLGPERSAHVVVPAAVGTRLRNRRPGPRLELGAVTLPHSLTHRLRLERVASHALVHVRNLRGRELGLRRGGVHADEASDVKVRIDQITHLYSGGKTINQVLDDMEKKLKSWRKQIDAQVDQD